ncbi:MAG: hypothetical protein CM15mP74_23770 [Halieaceae bacterium]|nr:MAG: hypothetical protein CM15mP74_23770 [Halieaceae bacterium]
MYSALKVDGQPLYKRARAGEQVERAARPVEIYGFELLSFEPVSRCVSGSRSAAAKGLTFAAGRRSRAALVCRRTSQRCGDASLDRLPSMTA